jgi:hypothetical protein
MNNVSQRFRDKFLAYQKLNSHLLIGGFNENIVRELIPNFNRLLLTRLIEHDEPYNSEKSWSGSSGISRIDNVDLEED